MFKKKHNKGLKILAFTFALLVFVSGYNVFADEKDNNSGLTSAEKDEVKNYVNEMFEFVGCNNADDKTKCKNELTKCKEGLTNNLDWKEDVVISKDKTKATFRIDFYKTVTKNGKQEKIIDTSKEKVKFVVLVNRSFSTDDSSSNGQKSTKESTKKKEYTVVGEYMSGEDFTINTNYRNGTYEIMEIRAILDSEAKYGDVDCKRRYVLDNTVKIDDDSEDEFDNPSINGICQRYKDGKLSDADLKINTKYKSLTGDGEFSWSKVKSVSNGESEFKSLLSYCFTDKTKYVYDDSMVLKQIYYAAQVVINKSKITSVNLPVHESDGFIKVDFDENGNLKFPDSDGKKIDLYCDAKSQPTGCDITTANVRKYYAVKETSKTMTYHYTEGAGIEKEICKISCMEELTVSYGPPVSVIAGMCFEYEIKVESKTTCSSKVTGEQPELSKYSYCTPNPVCNNHGAYYYDQGGPEEEFDECVKATDGGKYTQSAINKCYKKVYGNKKKNSNKISLAFADDAVQRVSSNWCSADQKSITDAEKVYYNYTSGGYNGGFYYRDGSTIRWQSYYGESKYKDDNNRKLADGTVIKTAYGCYWNQYSRYYFLNYSKGVRTVLNDENNKINYADGGDRIWYWNYHPNGNGIKQARECNERCVYYTWYCDSGSYLNKFAPTSNDPNGKETSSSYNAYIKDLEAYNDAISTCSAAETCDSETATYVLTVNKSTGKTKTCKMGETGDNCLSWEDENKNNNCGYNKNVELGYQTSRTDKDGKMCTYGTNTTLTSLETLKSKGCTGISNNSPIKEASGSCTGLNDKDMEYRTILTFPGTWINNKNGMMEYVKQDDIYAYDYLPGKFCVPDNAKSVNCDWYNWDQVGKRSDTCYTFNSEEYKDSGKVKITKYKGDYNILGRIESFGKYHWNVDINCFYALSGNGKNSCPTSEGQKKSGTNSCSPPPSEKNKSETRAAALDQLFPVTETTKASGTASVVDLEAEVKKLTNDINSDTENYVTKVADSQTSRDVGFNWSCDATNLLHKGYPVTPTALIRKIQTEGNDVYNKSSELDYEINLSVTQINAIRKDYSDSYTNFRTNNNSIVYGDKYNNYSIPFYQSELLRNTKYVSLVKGPSKNSAAIKCNNMISNGSSMSCDDLNTYVQQENLCPKLTTNWAKYKGGK